MQDQKLGEGHEAGLRAKNPSAPHFCWKLHVSAHLRDANTDLRVGSEVPSSTLLLTLTAVIPVL